MQPEITASLRTYHDLLVKWQKSINLVAPGTIPDAWTRHFEDSLQLVDMIPAGAKVVADLGSGGGFPGMVIALARPDLFVHLIESDSKKGIFLLTVSRETGAKNVDIHRDRIESVLPSIRADVVTARALAPLPDLMRLSESQWNRESPATLLWMKGANWQNEVALARQDHAFTLTHKASKTAPSAGGAKGDGPAILCITDVRPLHGA